MRKSKSGMPKATIPKPIDIRREAQEPRLPKPNPQNDKKENN